LQQLTPRANTDALKTHPRHNCRFMVTCSPLTAVTFCTLEYCSIACLFSVFYYLGGDTCVDNPMDMRAALHFR
jgi:hypothetical protein